MAPLLYLHAFNPMKFDLVFSSHENWSATRHPAVSCTYRQPLASRKIINETLPVENITDFFFSTIKCSPPFTICSEGLLLKSNGKKKKSYQNLIFSCKKNQIPFVPKNLIKISLWRKGSVKIRSANLKVNTALTDSRPSASTIHT